jgi:ABC-type transport system involved in multi-copper enzyme maturation permease subunit
MTAIATIAALTMREALRRRLVAALGVICLAVVALGAWGFYRLSHNSAMTSGEVDGALPQAFVLFMFMFSFVVALSASAIASPSVSAEIESGVLQAVVTRPVRRRDVILGKWLGLAAILAAYTAAVVGLQVAVIAAVSGFVPPQPAAAAAYLFAEGAVLLTVVLLLSTRLSALAAGVAGVALFGIAWLAGVVGALGASFGIPALQTASRICQYVVPTDGLWHGAIYALEPRSYVSLQLAQGDDRGNPFFAAAGPTWSYLTWAAVWLVVVLALSVASFERREL